ncbi:MULTISPECIES: DUF1206 domain-containing protein [Sphingobium]|uniref:DUF1206 domain-containing protein n=1 Tax=Sphingobium cupriresistens LL01 TaxID=1420583 RepID=A0A0J7Y059_9SPHN|nr:MULTISPECIES: DUF1206 domain-containing protein [Sphingobium]KMS57291.1 hypothetical protein V473_03465 [Sphingobium cupriresistens LL01]MBJ7377044.1 DUF1206 domain-containing protein [Sphingobium sp.]WCP14302.1 hypothetical protein sphantq_02746 [Sphingobium sp. AntQ-1]
MTYDDRMTLLARIGFAARGLVYILIGWFALDVAVNGGQLKDNQGALGTLASAPLGHVLLAICAIGFVGYAIWRLTEAITDPENRSRDIKGRFARAGYAVSGITHLALATAAARLALRQTPAQGGSPGDESAQSWSAWLLAQPGGTLMLIMVGIGFFAVAAAQAVKAYKARFDELDAQVPAPRYVRWVGRCGYAARALIFAIIGWFLIMAATNHDADRAGGLGEALQQLRSQSEGAAILGIVAFGLALFGMFSLIEARYRRIRVKKPGFL